MTDSIEDIIDEIRAGRMVVMMDDEDRENEGDLIVAAESITPEQVAFIVRHSSGIICTPMSSDRVEALRLPQMVPENTESHRTAFTVSVDYRHGTTTGISAADRATTIRALADPESHERDFNRPGHIFPLRADKGGVLSRAGHTEATVDLMRLAGKRPCGVICEIVNDDGTMKRAPELHAFAKEHGLKIGTIADLIRFRLANERTISRVASQQVETPHGPFNLVVYEDQIDNCLHLAMVRGTPSADRPTLVRVHVRNTLADLLKIQHASFGWPLDSALKRIAEEGEGVVVILRTPETPAEMVSRIAGLAHPEPQGEHEATDQELRTYGLGAQILSNLGVRKMRVLSAPKRLSAISGFDLEVIDYVQ